MSDLISIKDYKTVALIEREKNQTILIFSINLFLFVMFMYIVHMFDTSECSWRTTTDVLTFERTILYRKRKLLL